VLYALFFFALLLLCISAFFGAVTIGDQVKIIKDFGLFSMTAFTVAYAVITGASLLHKELSRKTVYNILAKPVRRGEFLCGKYLGMLATVVLMLVIMGAGLILFAACFSGAPDPLLLYACFFIFLQLVIVCACSIFFSAIVVTPMLSGAFSFGLFLAGRSSEYLLYFVSSGGITGIGAKLLRLAYHLLPHLDTLDISNQIVYGRAVGLDFMAWSLAYSAGYAGVLIILAGFIFKRREFN
jgi:Cu-processing system permease protein